MPKRNKKRVTHNKPFCLCPAHICKMGVELVYVLRSHKTLDIYTDLALPKGWSASPYSAAMQMSPVQPLLEKGAEVPKVGRGRG